MRIAHLADSHLDEREDLADNVRVHEEAVRQIADAKPDVILHAGDLHNRKSSPEVREAAVLILDRLANIAPTCLVRGNHDVPLDLLVYEGRKTTHKLTVCERPRQLELDAGRWRGDFPVKILALPWIDKAHMAASLEGTIGETDSVVSSAARTLLQTMRAWALPPEEGITIGVGHAMIGGSVVSTGQTLIGQGVELSAGDLGQTGAGLWCLGHIHKRQSWAAAGALVGYSGSLQRLNFGEPEEKGWTLYELEHDPGMAGGLRVDHVDFQPVPARRIERLEMDLEAVDALLRADPHQIEPLLGDLTGARVRLRFRCRPDQLQTVDLCHLGEILLRAGAADQKIEPVLEHQTRVRSEAIAEARSSWDKLEAWLASREIDDQALEGRLRDKLAELELEAAA